MDEERARGKGRGGRWSGFKDLGHQMNLLVSEQRTDSFFFDCFATTSHQLLALGVTPYRGRRPMSLHRHQSTNSPIYRRAKRHLHYVTSNPLDFQIFSRSP